MLITDPALVEAIRADREARGIDRFDEVRDGVYIVSPHPNNLHQLLVVRFWNVFDAILALSGGGFAIVEVNISDRQEGWEHNYRVPDVAVFLNTNTAQDCETHYLGGPDLAVEILSRNDLAREKLAFYASVNMREVLMVDRFPWAMELHRLVDGGFALVGKATVENALVLTSAVLPITFRLIAGEARPTIELARVDGTQSWRI